MSYNDKEISTQDGRPVALYMMEWGNTVWRYTSADQQITRSELVNGVAADVTYVPKAMSDSGMVQGGSSANDFTVDCPTDLPIVGLFRGTPPSETIWLTVRRIHMGETDSPIYWTGTVTNVKRLDLANAQIIGKPLTASFKRTGLRLCWTRECPHFLYDFDCKVSASAYAQTANLTALTATTLTMDLAGKPDQYYRGGYISWQANADGTKERRMISGQVGNTITVLGLTDGLAVGKAVTAYPGCDRSSATCVSKFNNLANFGGFEFMPGQSPFGTQIF